PVGSSIHMGMTFPSNSCMVRGLVPLSWYHMCRSGMIRPKNPSPQKGVILLAPPPVSLGAIPLASAAAYRAIRWESAAESPGTLMIIRSGREESSFSGTSVSAIGVLRVSRECLAGVDDFSARAGESVLLQKEGASDVLVMVFVLRYPDPVDEDVLQDAGNRGNHVGHTGGVLQRPVVEVVAHLVGVVVGGAEPCSQGRGTGLAQWVPRPVGAKEIVARPDLEVVGGLEGDLLGVTHTSGSEGVLPVPVRNDAGTDDQRPVSPSEVRSEAVRTLVSPRLVVGIGDSGAGVACGAFLHHSRFEVLVDPQQTEGGEFSELPQGVVVALSLLLYGPPHRVVEVVGLDSVHGTPFDHSFRG